MKMKKTCTIDIEGNDLLSNLIDYSSFPYKLKPSAKLWCVVITDAETRESKSAVKEEITKEWVEESLNEYEIIVAHNGIKFDFLVLKLFGVLDYRIGYINESDSVFGRPCKFLDTLILSRLSDPDRPARHSLKAWGLRLKNNKDDYRQQCIEAGLISKDSPYGSEFKEYNSLMLPYCVQDTLVNVDIYFALEQEFHGHDWGTSIKQEHKLADLAIRREMLGFGFDKEKALVCLEDLNNKLQELADKVEPILPPKPLNKTELKYWTPPKTQLKKDGSLSSHMVTFLEKTGAELKNKKLLFNNTVFDFPCLVPIKTHIRAEMKDFDHIKMHLISLGWIPTEWSDRDLTKDSKKKILSLEKRKAALTRWWTETIEDLKYFPARLNEADLKVENGYDKLYSKLDGKWGVKVPTSPKIRVGVEKELCPNLIKLGDKVEFAKDFANWLTYRHRRNSIAGGDVKDLDLDLDAPSTGFLSLYREEDGRIPTAAIEIGAVTNRYVHIGVANIPRVTSTYGEEMRSLFTSGNGGIFFGFDFNSLEARVMAHYVHKYPDGVELGNLFTGEKPNDWHTKQGIAMNIPRTDAKSVDYGILYGATWGKIKKMTGKTDQEAKDIVESFWESSKPLKMLRDNVIKYWEGTGSKFILGVDGRKINVRSKHSLLNSLFQSAGVIYAKYVTIRMFEHLEKQGLIIDPFIGKPDVCSMIEYHDECDLFVNPNLFEIVRFTSKQEALDYVSGWDQDQLSAIGHNNDTWYICKPNVVSKAITQSMQEIEELLKIKVPMGYDYMVGRNWAQCH